MIKPCHPCQKTRIMIQEIERRRTFAIISHPDAGKTTLTEKFLLFGGQIQVAGAVKNNKIKKTATSDWMDIEKQRGISVSTSVMEFDYTPTSPSPSQGGESDSSPSGRLGEVYKVNILDTPGHQDFAEDTYRTLTAVDSAIIVVDGAKGVETQTRKLMNVCRMRNTPVIIFINKMDREGRDPFDLLDELEQELEIKVRPLSWPINQGAKFKGVYNIYEEKLDLFTPDKQRVTEKVNVELDSDELAALRQYCVDHPGPCTRCILLETLIGERPGELCSIMVKDVDLANMQIAIRRTETRDYINGRQKDVVREGAKTEAGIRRVSIPATAKPFVEELVRLAEGTDGKYLFTQEPGYFKTRYAGKRIRSRQLRRHLKEICEKIGIIYKPPHKLRKTYASILKDSDIDEQTITDMIGHVDFGITEQYYLRSRKRAPERSQKLGQIKELQLPSPTASKAIEEPAKTY